MKKLLADLFPHNKDRQDFFIALIIIAIFIVGILSYIIPNRADKLDILTAEEANKRVNELEYQQLSFDEGIITDIDGYHPYFDHRQKEVIYNNRQIKTDLAATNAITPPILDKITHQNDAEAPDEDAIMQDVTEDEDANTIPEAEILIEEDFDKSAIQEEVPPELDEEGNVIDNSNSTTDIVEEYDVEADAAVIEAAREKERLAAEAEKARQEKLEKEKAATARAKRNAIGTFSGCHLIVGAFKNKRNAQSFKEKVTAKNFTVTIGQVRGKNYVGIPVDCTDKNAIQSTQQRVNNTFNINSWVLKN